MLRNLSTFFLRTLREDPADAEVNSHKLLVRAVYIGTATTGIYSFPLHDAFHIYLYQILDP